MKNTALISYVSIIILLFICNIANGQNTRISGIVKDSLSNNAEVAAIVQFYKAEDSTKPVAYTTTDENGSFVHTLTEIGNYKLLLDNLGKKRKYVDFSIDNQSDIDLGTILVQDDATMLEAGSVTALSNLVSIDVDKVTYKVENDVEAKTKSVLDILRKIPLVSVDGMGKITVNGNHSFLVYMDGKKNQMMTDNPSEIFRSMPASMIKDIEVITDPGARYDAEGVGGVLNLTSSFSATSSKEEDLYNGSVSLGGSFRKLNAGVFFSAKKNKLTVSMNVNGIRDISNNTGLYSERIQRTNEGQIKTTSDGISKNVALNFFGNISASYEINKYNLLTLTAGVVDVTNNENQTRSSSIETPVDIYTYDESMTERLRADIFNANIDYQHNWKNKPGQSFVVSYQLNGRPFKTSTSNIYKPINFNSATMNDRKDYVYSNSMTHTVQSDFILPLGKNHRLTTGAKVMMRHNFSDIDSHIWKDDAFVSDQKSNMNYDFYNNIGALYAEYDGTVKKFKLRGGLRYEHTWQHTTYDDMEEKDFNLNYGNLVPNGSIQYNINEKQNMGLTYSMSIKRPGITYLNPYVDITDPSSKKYGNPDLKAEKGHQIGLTYNLYSGKWIVTMRLQQTLKNNGISPYIFYDDEHILNTTYGNIINSSNTALNTYLSWSPAQKTRLSVNGRVSYNIFKSDELDMKKSGWLFNASADIEQILPADYILNLRISYMPNALTLQSKTNGIWDAMLSVSKSFFKDRLNVSLSGRSNISRHMRAYMTTLSTGTDFTSTNTIMMPWKDVLLNISYKFGGDKRISIKRSKKQKSVNDQLDME